MDFPPQLRETLQPDEPKSFCLAMAHWGVDANNELSGRKGGSVPVFSGQRGALMLNDPEAPPLSDFDQ
jgi:hypothetical protein